MADNIELLASGAHANVATVYKGTTPQLTGYRSGEVPLTQQVKSTPVDVSGYSTLRLVLDVTAMANRHGYENGQPSAAALRVAIEDGPTESGPWRVLHTFQPVRDLGQQRVMLGGLDRFARASWWFVRSAYPESTITDEVAFTWSLAGEAIPEAA